MYSHFQRNPVIGSFTTRLVRIFYYTLSAGSYTENKHAYVRATDVYEALDMAAHKIQFDILMAPQIRPGAPTYDGYEITSVGTA